MSEDDGVGGETPLEEVNIQHVIRERKAERKLQAEQKRQADLQRIRDMKSITGIDPLQRFPTEIWEMILHELGSHDRGNAWQIHPLFRELMESTRIRDILLPQILKLDGFFSTNNGIFGRWWNQQLRCISKTTRDSFDHYMDVIVMKRIHGQEGFTDCERDKVTVCYSDIEENGMLKRLLDSFSSGTGKRFFPRTLFVLFYEDTEMNTEHMTTLLEKIGDQIWHFTFFVHDIDLAKTDDFCFSKMYIILQGWISLMPNLRWLEIEFSLESPTRAPNKVIQKQIVSIALLQSHPFPHLARLERLSFRSYHRNPDKTGTFHDIFGAILRANQHVKMLDLNFGGEEVDCEPDSPLLPPHLTQSLQLKRFTVCDDFGGYKYALLSMAMIRPIMNCNWELQTIVLSLTSNLPEDSVISVLRFLQKFPTLENVKLNQLEDSSIGETDDLEYLKLSNLKDLELNITASGGIEYKQSTHSFFSLQFLLHCKMLKRITWKLNDFNDSELRKHMKKIENEKHGNMLDFRAGLKYLYDSNIWLVFPKLDIIDVQLQKDKNERCSGSTCQHDYRRANVESMSMRKFWKDHRRRSHYGEMKFCLL